MKKISLVVLSFSALFTFCKTAEKIDRIRENGVEVVLNHIEPYDLKKQPSTFDLQTVLTIDTEREDLAKAGMGSAGEFDVDGQGNIFIVGFKNLKNFIYRFDSQGRLLNSFGRNGQGPGEIEWPFLDRVFDDGRIALTDLMSKYIVFDRNGNALREFRPRFSISYIYPLDNGRLLVQKPRYEARTSKYGSYPYALCLCESNFAEIKELDHFHWPADGGNEKRLPYFLWRVSSGHIYIANQERGYEILDYDLEGNLRRKIRKEYHPVAPTPAIRKSILGPNYNQPRVARYFPDPMPPICSLFVDDEGRLFVMTYESGDRSGEYVWDIFNSDGVFIGRKSLGFFWLGLQYGSKYAMIKKGLFYGYKEKENGYRELTVHKIIWK